MRVELTTYSIIVWIDYFFWSWQVALTLECAGFCPYMSSNQPGVTQPHVSYLFCLSCQAEIACAQIAQASWVKFASPYSSFTFSINSPSTTLSCIPVAVMRCTLMLFVQHWPCPVSHIPMDKGYRHKNSLIVLSRSLWHYSHTKDVSNDSRVFSCPNLSY